LLPRIRQPAQQPVKPSQKIPKQIVDKNAMRAIAKKK